MGAPTMLPGGSASPQKMNSGDKGAGNSGTAGWANRE